MDNLIYTMLIKTQIDSFKTSTKKTLGSDDFIGKLQQTFDQQLPFLYKLPKYKKWKYSATYFLREGFPNTKTNKKNYYKKITNQYHSENIDVKFTNKIFNKLNLVIYKNDIKS